MATMAISKRKLLLLNSGLQKMKEQPWASAGAGVPGTNMEHL